MIWGQIKRTERPPFPRTIKASLPKGFHEALFPAIETELSEEDIDRIFGKIRKKTFAADSYAIVDSPVVVKKDQNGMTIISFHYTLYNSEGRKIWPWDND